MRVNIIDPYKSTIPITLPDLTHWINQTLHQANYHQYVNINICFCGQKKIRAFNKTYRQVDKATDVLSFPSDFSFVCNYMHHLGDIMISTNVIAREAQRQHKNPRHHLCHIIVHGTLHLLGYDHINQEDAEAMEAMEIAILKIFKIDSPYDDTSS